MRYIEVTFTTRSESACSNTSSSFHYFPCITIHCPNVFIRPKGGIFKSRAGRSRQASSAVCETRSFHGCPVSLFAIATRAALGPTQSPIRLVTRALSYHLPTG
jgi:hypothetical protein